MTPTPVPVIDGHNDVLLRLWSDDHDPVTAFRDGREGDIDLPRAREGGLAAGLFATFAPSGERFEPTVTDEGYAYPYPDAPDTEDVRRVTYEQLALLHRLVRAVDGIRLVTDTAGLEACLDGEAVGAVAHLEGAAAVDSDRSNLDLLYAAGVRSVGPVWSRPNAFGHGVPAEYPGDPGTGPGLTDAGRDLSGRATNGASSSTAHTSTPPVSRTSRRSRRTRWSSHTRGHTSSAPPLGTSPTTSSGRSDVRRACSA